MQVPVLFGIVVIIVVWLQYEIRKSKKLFKKNRDRFWQEEAEANRIRRKDISNLEYISIPITSLPMNDHEDATINSYRDTILILSEKKILNLSGQSNTELKFQYGTANINILSECDSNYILLVSILHKWGERLNSLGYVSDAILVLEFAVTCLTDVYKTYMLLALIYKEQQLPDKIDWLINIIPLTKTRQQNILVKDLTKIMNS